MRPSDPVPYSPLTLVENAASASELDAGLPRWARRGNPIVRQQLGIHWRIVAPDLLLLAQLYGVQAALVTISLLVPVLLMVLMPAVTVSLVVVPVALIYYGRALWTIAVEVSRALARARQQGRLDLLRLTPLSDHQIILSMTAAAIWRQMELLAMLATAVVLCSLPLLIIQYDSIVPLETQPLAMRGLLLTSLLGVLVRIPLEVLMMGAVGAAVGTYLPYPRFAGVATGFLGVAYFAFVNGVRLLPLGVVGQIAVELVLPLVLPLLIIGVALLLTIRGLHQR